MKHIFIIGSRGYHAKYGGWETFVSNFVDNFNDDDTIFHISELSDRKKEEYKINNNIIVTPFYISNKGGIKMLLCTIKAFNYYLKYIKNNKIDSSYIYVLGLKLGPLLKMSKKELKRLNVTTLVNPDGLEHMRSKWGYLVKKYFLLSEKWMLKNTDIIICDAQAIKKYIDNKYPELRDKTIYIAYGTNKINFDKTKENEVLKEYKLKKDKYLLMVGRMVPENNFELIIKEFMKSKINKELIIISNLSSSNYYNRIEKETCCLNDKRIRFIDGVYDEIKLSIIRMNAFLYIHGHSVGGTNPSLLEALSTTNLNILYDVNFNSDIGRDSCLYFSSKKELSKILDNIGDYDRVKMGNECKQIIKTNYTWNIIVEKYKKIFK